ncbi:hypothetical protein POM88_051336 [Heracleum sosnowskyi]|uniref:Aldehyde dehydrogenase domain-containing protein n=1 Tax=Heracleum sosnowskyi TaxID=360622 RepID=A0AAD8M168_9APIA|nr:hypothetical protein POM88_051336 [Heracleum sosnowskyi]
MRKLPDSRCLKLVNKFIEPTIILDPRVDAAIMEEEIFGPFLPIITLDDIHESIEFINSREKPLTIYAFTKDENPTLYFEKQFSAPKYTYITLRAGFCTCYLMLNILSLIDQQGHEN